jgi:hypothetical protein
MNDRFDQLTNELVNKTSELHFLRGALNNLEKAQEAQEGQKEWGLSRATGAFITDLKHRVADLAQAIVELEAEQKELYRKQMQEANDQISMSMGYL